MHIRPELEQFIQAVAQSNFPGSACDSGTEQQQTPTTTSGTDPTTIHLAVVTFSGQIGLIRGVLNSILSKGGVVGMKIPIRGHDGSWKEPDPSEGWWPENADLNYDSAKQTHMLSAVQEIKRTSSLSGIAGTATPTIRKTSTVLIDDDDFNVQVAQENEVRAVRLYPNNPGRLFSDIMALL